MEYGQPPGARLPGRADLPPRPGRLAGGLLVAGAIDGLVALVFWSILATAAAAPGNGASPDIAHLLRMTAIQAGLTTVLSLLVGTALAWALNRLRFFGRDAVVGLFATAIVTPGVVVAFGILAVWGRSGWINQLSEALSDTPWGQPAFGLGGILAAHLILDGAFAARLLLARLDAIPEMRLKTGQSLGLSAWQRFRLVDWPALRGSLPGLAAIIFLLAFTSFPIVLLLGGGPANQTLEVAIYSAVRLDFDLRAAVSLALVQIGVCSLVILASAGFSAVPAHLEPSRGRHWADRAPARLLQALILGICLLGFVLPLLAVLVQGLGPGLLPLLARPGFWAATGTSLAIGGASAALALALALLLSLARAATGAPLLRLALTLPAFTYLAVPAVVLGLGFFLLVRNAGLDPAAFAPVVVVVGNALLALPFAVAALSPPLEAIVRRQGRLIRAVGLRGLLQFRLVEWPLIGRDFGVALALAFCFSLGDLGLVSLFGTDDFVTLPLLMVRALGAYRTGDAGAIAALMLLLTLAAFTLLPRLFERIAHARP